MYHRTQNTLTEMSFPRSSFRSDRKSVFLERDSIIREEQINAKIVANMKRQRRTVHDSRTIIFRRNGHDRILIRQNLETNWSAPANLSVSFSLYRYIYIG